MYMPDMINHAVLLIITCFSFLIFNFTCFMNRDDSLLKLQGFTFFVSFFMGSASYFFINYSYSYFILSLSEAAMLFFLTLMLYMKPRPERYGLVKALILISPIILTLLISIAKASSIDWLQVYANPLVFVTLAVFALSKLKTGNENRSILFWSILSLLFSGMSDVFPSYPLLQLVSLLLKFTAYLLFFMYFYRETYGLLTIKINEADKKLTAINRSLDLEVRKRVFEIERSNERLLSISKTDPLTNLLNKTSIIDAIINRIELKQDGRFCVLIFDIDNFKSINDTLGHVVGDKCIKRLSLIAKNSIREVDSIGRYGGDEFIILLPGATLTQAKEVAERFRKRVEETTDPKFTISIGIASYPEDGNTWQTLVSNADDALYVSKRNGRNRISFKGDLNRLNQALRP